MTNVMNQKQLRQVLLLFVMQQLLNPMWLFI